MSNSEWRTSKEALVPARHQVQCINVRNDEYRIVGGVSNRRAQPLLMVQRATMRRNHGSTGANHSVLALRRSLLSECEYYIGESDGPDAEQWCPNE
jgi:hypothetical protein